MHLIDVEMLFFEFLQMVMHLGKLRKNGQFLKMRNVRIPLAANNVNQFGEHRSTNSMWPIFIINNNIPPWMSINREHIMLAMIVQRYLMLTLIFQTKDFHVLFVG